MAATVSSPWGKPGAWALDAEEHEAELQQQQPELPTKNDAVAADFPSLSAAVKQPKKKKNQTTLSLAEFATYGTQSTHSQPQVLTHEELMSLPTGPRYRSPEELASSGSGRLGGGFRSYGLTRDNHDSSREGRGSRFSSDSSREIVPSRADENDDWSKTKKFSASNSFERRDRGERGSSFFDSQSKADESESWVANKATVEPRRFEKRGSFDSLSRGRNESSDGSYRHGSHGGGADSDSWGRKKEETTNVMGSAGRPKLVLQPRSLPLAESNNNGAVAKPKGSSPFGDARPREEVLKEKGKDWKEIDEKIESVKIGNDSNERKAGWRSPAKGSGRERNERSWKKPETADSNGSHPNSDEKTENGIATESGHTAEDELAEGN